MNNIRSTEQTSKAVKPPFEWRDQKGVFHKVTEMETRHLFFTLRMVWNHSAPDDLKIEPFKRYRFGDFYTPEYIVAAVRSISLELGTREDLTPYFRKNLTFMADNFMGLRESAFKGIHHEH